MRYCKVNVYYLKKIEKNRYTTHSKIKFYIFYVREFFSTMNVKKITLSRGGGVRGRLEVGELYKFPLGSGITSIY